MRRETIINEFLDFCKTKDIQLGGSSLRGYGLERTEFRPLHPGDYQAVIDDFITSNPGPAPEVVEIKVSAEKAVTDAITNQKDWVREELKRHHKNTLQSLIATVCFNAAAMGVLAAIILY